MRRPVQLRVDAAVLRATFRLRRRILRPLLHVVFQQLLTNVSGLDRQIDAGVGRRHDAATRLLVTARRQSVRRAVVEQDGQREPFFVLAGMNNRSRRMFYNWADSARLIIFISDLVAISKLHNKITNNNVSIICSNPFNININLRRFTVL